MRWAFSASSRSWVAMNMAIFCSASSLNIFRISSLTLFSSLPVGSSAIINRGDPINALAIETLCLSPELSILTGRFSLPVKPILLITELSSSGESF